MLDSAVKQFMEAGDQTTAEFNPRQSALYVGLILEEVSELLQRISKPLASTIGGAHVLDFAKEANELGERFKDGTCDALFENCDRAGVLDDAVDIGWVACGLGYSIGADVEGAVREVAASNMSKCNPETGKMDKHPITGKVMKGANYFPPSLAKFVLFPGHDSEGGSAD